MKFDALTAAAILSIATPAYAADLGPAPAEPAAPVYLPFSWTGFYVGGHVGYGFGSSSAEITGVPVFGDWSSNGILGGAQVGYNWQVNSFVLGAEIDGSFSGVSGDLNFGGIAATSTDLDWLATGRLRAGYAFDRALFYVTGGVAVAGVKNDFVGLSHTDTDAGWTAGLGIEYAFNDKWSAKLEYLHVGLADNSLPGTPLKFENDFDLVRVGINYRF